MALKDGGGQGFVNPQPYCKQEYFLLTNTDRHDEIHSLVDGHFSSFKIILKGDINMAASAFNHLLICNYSKCEDTYLMSTKGFHCGMRYI